MEIENVDEIKDILRQENNRYIDTGMNGALAMDRWTLFTPFLSQALGKLSNNEAVVTATSAFRNEPYDL